ncbi:MAG: bifunctional phosphoribosylaminoimidazolecarboxamide formyltransferase/IMP cyclohydrolase [Ignavibacteriaceae bacterium]
MEKFALLSVSDKSRITEFARELKNLGYTIIATGRTAKLISESSVEVKEISSVTGFPEIFDGRVKTLHPFIFGGILFRRENPADNIEAEKNKINPVEIVCVNLYPFEETIKKPDADLNEIIENIDIGGPSLIRAAAKNYKYVSVLTSPAQYDPFLTELKKGSVPETFKQKLAVEAFSHTAHYDAIISNWFSGYFKIPPTHMSFTQPRSMNLRYGENPHQNAAVYGNFGKYFHNFHGKELSYNNILDLISATELVEDLGINSCAIIKHNNPAGAASGKDSLEAYTKALMCDPVSSFGGIVAFSSPVDEQTAKKLNEIFLEVISAPDFSDQAVDILKKKRDRRLVKQLLPLKNSTPVSFRNIPGGFIIQDPDTKLFDENSLKVVTIEKPDDRQMADLKFAWIVAKHTKSNAIVYAKDLQTLGVGAGQMSRLDSAKIARMKAEQFGLTLKDSVAASDAFFPFPDGLEEIINSGAVSVIQPGGSVRDNEVIETADKNRISMIFTGIRHFKH